MTPAPSLRRSLFFALAEKYSVTAIQTLATLVLARLLTPSEIGVYSVGAAILAIAHTVRDFGVNSYLVREETITRERVRAALGVSILIAWALGGALLALRGPIARFYEARGVAEVIGVLAICFFIIPFNVPALALLRREFRFRTLYFVGLANGVLHSVVSVGLAALGFGFMSLAWASLAGVAAMAALLAIVRPKDVFVWPTLSGSRVVASFGGVFSAGAILEQLGKAAPDLIVGRLIGFEAVGLLSRATGTIMLFDRVIVQAIAPVALPIFAHYQRGGGDLLAGYVKSLQYITVLAWPFFLFLAVFASPVVLLLYGSQWLPAAPLLQLLCVAGALRACFCFSAPLLTSLGAVKRILQINALGQAAQIALLLVATPYGLLEAAGAVVVGTALLALLNHRAVARALAMRPRDAASAFGKSALVTALCAPVVIAGSLLSDAGENSMLEAAAVAAAYGAAWIGAVFATRHPISAELLGVASRVLAPVAARFRPGWPGKMRADGTPRP